jgi:hypothetical protein
LAALVLAFAVPVSALDLLAPELALLVVLTVVVVERGGGIRRSRRGLRA